MTNRSIITCAAVIAGLAITQPARADWWGNVTSPSYYQAWKALNLPDGKQSNDICYDVKKDIISLRNHTAVIFSLAFPVDQGISMEWAKQFQNARLCQPDETKTGVWVELENAINAGLAPSSASRRAQKKAPSFANH